MSKFKVGMNVVFIGKDNAVTSGVIDFAPENSDVVIVADKDGNKYKRLYHEIGIVEEKEDEPVKEEPKKDVKIKVKEKSEITITREEFTHKGAELCTKKLFEKGPIEALKVGELVAELAVVLFVDIET